MFVTFARSSDTPASISTVTLDDVLWGGKGGIDASAKLSSLMTAPRRPVDDRDRRGPDLVPARRDRRTGRDRRDRARCSSASIAGGRSCRTASRGDDDRRRLRVVVCAVSVAFARARPTGRPRDLRALRRHGDTADRRAWRVTWVATTAVDPRARITAVSVAVSHRSGTWLVLRARGGRLAWPSAFNRRHDHRDPRLARRSHRHSRAHAAATLCTLLVGLAAVAITLVGAKLHVEPAVDRERRRSPSSSSGLFAWQLALRASRGFCVGLDHDSAQDRARPRSHCRRPGPGQVALEPSMGVVDRLALGVLAAARRPFVAADSGEHIVLERDLDQPAAACPSGGACPAAAPSA